MTILKYVGNGAHVAGVPACDLTAEMIEACGWTIERLLALRNGAQPLYIRAEARKEKV